MDLGAQIESRSLEVGWRDNQFQGSGDAANVHGGGSDNLAVGVDREFPGRTNLNGLGLHGLHILEVRLFQPCCSNDVPQNICNALVGEDPAHVGYYQNNLRAFHADLDKLDGEVTKILKKLRTRQFMAFHPAWGYFARDYALEQIPIEVEGKEPSARALADLIKRAKQEGVKVVFVQAQFSTRNAETVAQAIGGRIVQIDPLAKDYLNNMRKIAETFRKVIQ